MPLDIINNGDSSASARSKINTCFTTVDGLSANAVTSGGALGTPSSGTLTNCTSIPAGQLTGTVATARLGTGTADATTYLRGDATWATVSGGIGGSTGATDNIVLRSNGTGGATLQNSLLTIDDSGNLIPAAWGTQDIGTGALYWKQAYIGAINVNGHVISINSAEARFGYFKGNSLGGFQSGPQTDCITPINKDFGNGVIQFGQVTSGGTPTSNTARIYAKDVSGTAEMFVKDEAGNETQISPHNTTAPEGLVDSPFDEIGYTANYYTGIITYTNKQRQIAGRADAQFFETFEEHNLRLGESLEILDWDTVQADHVAKRDEEREAWATRKADWEAQPENAETPFAEREPELLTAKPQPQWLVDQLAGKEAFLAARWQVNHLKDYKIWANAQAFMAEFTMEEKGGIALSTDPTIAALRLELSTWFSEVHSTDPRVIAGLDKLVELSIITEDRRTEIISL